MTRRANDQPLDVNISSTSIATPPVIAVVMPLSFAKGGTITTPAGAVNYIVWRAPYAATVTNVRGYVSGATGSAINARKNGTLTHLAADLTLGSADTWLDGGAVQNVSYAIGDKMEVMLTGVGGSPTEVAIQIDLTRP